MIKIPKGMAAILLLAGSMALIPAAQAVVIDFESAIIGTDQTANYFEDGFRLSSIVGDYDVNPSDPFIGDGQYLALERTDDLDQSKVRIDMFGALFDFESLVSSSFGGRITFSDGTSELFGDFPTQPVTVAFSGHTNLTWIELSSRSNDFLRVDNITFSVPEPSALVLMALGLTGVGFARLRKTA
ncbi:MAG: PEP-CTERM sorting domain-containing protein [Candidatus Thiodiazotropha sp. (ex Monitilora ramsayi)]|nr:PEP-CTERM sorting domain-containing protein [Candidatus Thiodiazotropha sp. (ex Monitilora ramsayi)]